MENITSILVMITALIKLIETTIQVFQKAAENSISGKKRLTSKKRRV